MQTATLEQPPPQLAPLDARIAVFAAAVLGEAVIAQRYRRGERVPLIDGSAAHVIMRLAEKCGLRIEETETEWRIVSL